MNCSATSSRTVDWKRRRAEAAWLWMQNPCRLLEIPSCCVERCRNIVRNAIRYSPKGRDVEVRLKRRNAHALVDIRDYGPGVPDESLHRIFDAFYRVGEDRDRASGGVGLGLAIARRAIELHHGTVTARNAHPGLVVEVELPVGGHG